MDQIFDRFERLFKSWVAQESEKLGGEGSRGKTRRSGDPDLDSAMDELDDFLDKDRLSAEARQRAREEESARQRARSSAGSAGSSRPSGPDPRLVKAYETLGLAYGASFDEVKAKYKKLLMKHHPDKHGGNAENMKKATEMSTRINAAYQTIETWSTTGKIPD